MKESKQATVEENEALPLKAEIGETTKHLSLAAKFKNAKSSVTVEPVLAVFVMSSVLAILAVQKLNLDKACRVNLDFGDEICSVLIRSRKGNYTSEENQVQTLIAKTNAWKSVVHAIVPLFLILFIGAWSDKTGKRKICMLMPIFGEIMTMILNMISTYLFYGVSVEWTVFMEIIFQSLTGGLLTMFIGTFSYIGDITPKETRTFRMGILSLCLTVGMPLGMGLSGIMLRYLGYYGVFGISALLQFCNFCYVLFAIEDHTWLRDQNKVLKTGCTGFLLNFFDFHGLKNTLEIIYKKTQNNRRIKLCLLLTLVSLYFGVIKGEQNIGFMFVRYRLHWDEVKYSIFNVINSVTHSLGTLFSISVFSKKLKADDAVLGMISTSTKVCGSFVMAFARNDFEFYLSPFIEILSGTTGVALKSIASKSVSHQEQGKLFSLFSIVETVIPLVFAPLYSQVYIATFRVLPGTVYLLSALATIPAFIIFGWFYHKHRKENRERRLDLPTALNDGASPEVCT